jgi:serine/threonine-protein kinase RsbW
MNASDSDRKHTLLIGNTIAELEKVVAFVDSFGAAHNIPQAVIDDLNLSLDELLNNTVSYAYEDQVQHSIAVTLSISGRYLIAEIQDDGKPFDPRDKASPAIEGAQRSREGGLGLRFVTALMDEVYYERKGQYNIVSIKKKFVEE